MRDAAQEETAYRDTVRCSAEAYARLINVNTIRSLPLYQKEIARDAMRALGRFTMSQQAELLQQPVLPKRETLPEPPAANAPGLQQRNKLTEAVEAAGAFWETTFDLLSGPNRLSEEHRALAMEALNKLDAFVISVWEDDSPAPTRAAAGEPAALRL